MILLALIFAAAAGYQFVALGAAVAHLRRREQRPEAMRFSILKPMRGVSPGLEAAIRSHAEIRHENFEILLGYRDSVDPVVPELQRLMRLYPGAPLRLIHCPEEAPNTKVATLEQLAEHARYEVFVVNDADIRVAPDYLAHLERDLVGVGLATCLYRGDGNSFPTRFEALGIATDFAPSALVAPFVGVNEFGLGSTLAFRRSDLDRAGGFAALRDYIADDYQLGKRISDLGLTVRMSRMVVATHLGAGAWGDVWRHQVRWARTIRLSRGAYYGLPVTFATVWSLIAFAAGYPAVGTALLVLRMASGLFTGLAVLQDDLTKRLWVLIPLRDLFGAAVWVAGAFGNTVAWGGRRLRLDKQGRIEAATR